MVYDVCIVVTLYHTQKNYVAPLWNTEREEVKVQMFDIGHIDSYFATWKLAL